MLRSLRLRLLTFLPEVEPEAEKQVVIQNDMSSTYTSMHMALTKSSRVFWPFDQFSLLSE